MRACVITYHCMLVRGSESKLVQLCLVSHDSCLMSMRSCHVPVLDMHRPGQRGPVVSCYYHGLIRGVQPPLPGSYGHIIVVIINACAHSRCCLAGGSDDLAATTCSKPAADAAGPRPLVAAAGPLPCGNRTTMCLAAAHIPVGRQVGTWHRLVGGNMTGTNVTHHQAMPCGMWLVRWVAACCRR